MRRCAGSADRQLAKSVRRLWYSRVLLQAGPSHSLQRRRKTAAFITVHSTFRRRDDHRAVRTVYSTSGGYACSVSGRGRTKCTDRLRHREGLQPHSVPPHGSPPSYTDLPHRARLVTSQYAKPYPANPVIFTWM